MIYEIRPLTRRDLQIAHRDALCEYLAAQSVCFLPTDPTEYLRVLALGLFDMDEVTA